MIQEILEFNKKFVAEDGARRFATDKYPDKKLLSSHVWTRAWWNFCLSH